MRVEIKRFQNMILGTSGNRSNTLTVAFETARHHFYSVLCDIGRSKWNHCGVIIHRSILVKLQCTNSQCYQMIQTTRTCKCSHFLAPPIHGSTGPPKSQPQTASGSLHVFTQLHQNSLFVTMSHSMSSQNCPFLWGCRPI